MYRLYKTPNGQVQQVPVNEPIEDQGEQFPNPLEAKGENRNEAPFVEQQRNQFEIIKKNETQQAKFQTKKLQNSNYQILNMKIVPTDSGSTASYYSQTYNQATAVGTPMDAGVLFGTNTADVTKAKYYNIVYANARWVYTANVTGNLLEQPSYIEFYLGQKLDTGDFAGKIPRQIEAVANTTDVFTITTTGAEYGVQSFGIDIYGENAYYTQSPDLKGMRACGLGLKRILLNLSDDVTLSEIELHIEIGYDLDTEGNNY